MKALIVIDVQNEFTENGKRPIPSIQKGLAGITKRVNEARENGSPIIWIRHFNKPDESPAFMPGTWGSEFVAGFGPKPDSALEVEMHKNVYGAFTGTDIGNWLKERQINEVLIVGFYSHGCVSTTTREAIMAGLNVLIDPQATGSCDIDHPQLGRITAEESRIASMLHLANMGAILAN